MRKCKGFTFIELMVSIAILSILAAIVLPNFTSYLAKTRVDSEISQLHRLLLTARNSAINFDQNVILCPLDQNNHCITDWQGELSVFIDVNDNDIFEPLENEILIQVKSPISSGEKLQYGLYRNRIKFAPTGHTIGWGSNGTLKYCPEGFEHLSRAIIVATSGRFYLSHDKNFDGEDETRSGQKIVCRK